MSDYFDHVEQGLRAAVGRRAHMPWYYRLRPRPSRPLAVAVACLIATGSALAATGVFQTGEAVGPEVPGTPTANEGVPIPASITVLPLRVADPEGGPPWGLRQIRTTRGLMCVQVGRIVDGRIGVLGREGAFRDDGAFHPFSPTFMEGPGCGTEDGHGDAFVNVYMHGVPDSALFGERLHANGGCYRSRADAAQCPASALRDIFFGLLGPAARSVTHLSPTGGSVVTSTAGEDGAYLIVLPHSTTRCPAHAPECFGGNDTGYTGGPQMSAYEVVRAVSYKDAAACVLPTPAALAATETARENRFEAALRSRFPSTYLKLYREGVYVRGSMDLLTPAEQRAFQALRRPYESAGRPPSCPTVGYVPPTPAHRITHAEVATGVSAHLEAARHYCEPSGGGGAVGCSSKPPAGYRRIDMQGPPEQLLVVEFTARVAVSNFDSHFEISTTDPLNRPGTHCPVSGHGSSFGPTDTNLRAGERVRYVTFFLTQCPGVSHIKVGLVTVDGPSGSMPVPGLPGQSPEIPVGRTSIVLP